MKLFFVFTCMFCFYVYSEVNDDLVQEKTVLVEELDNKELKVVNFVKNSIKLNKNNKKLIKTLKVVAPYKNHVMKDWLLEQVSVFENKHSSIKINLKLFELEEYKNIVVKMLNNESVDIVILNENQNIRDMIVSNLFIEMSDVVRKSNMMLTSLKYETFFNNEDRVYGLPFYLKFHGFYYRKDILKKYALKKPSSWKDFLEVSKELKKKKIIPLAYSVDDDMLDVFLSYFFLKKEGIYSYNSFREGYVSYNGENFKRVMNDYHNFLKEKVVSENFLNYSIEDARSDFLGGRSAFLLDSKLDFLSVYNEDIGYMEFPSFSEFSIFKERAKIGFVDGIHILRESKNIKISKKFIVFLYKNLKKMPNNLIKFSLLKNKRKSLFYEEKKSIYFSNTIVPSMLESIKDKNKYDYISLLKDVFNMKEDEKSLDHLNELKN